MNRKHLIVAALAALPATAIAETGAQYQCTAGELVRRVEIMYETGMTLPCEVHYHKDTEAPGESQVLWRAMNEQGYCERKTTEFIEMLESSGWSCDESGAQAPAAAPEPAAAPAPVEAAEPVDPPELIEDVDDSAALDPVPPDESED